MSDSLSPEVTDLLRCPVTHQRLRQATPGELETSGAEFPEGAWITDDGTRAYPVRDGFPILVPTESMVISTDTAGASE